MDSAPEFAGALRATEGETRRLLWRVGAYEVDASFVARPGGADLLAQVVPGGDDPETTVTGVVAVVGARGVRTSAPIEPEGRFTIRGLAPGVYTIEGSIGATRFVLPPVHVE